MSEMSFRQAKELVEKLDLTEVSVKKACDDLNTSSSKFNNSLKKQVQILQLLNKKDKKINILRMLLVLTIGFIAGLFIGFYFLKDAAL